MFKISNFIDENNHKNDNIVVTDLQGPFAITEYRRDLSVNPLTTSAEFFDNKMNICKRQLLCNLSDTEGVTIQAGAMQWMIGNVESTTRTTCVGDFLGKAFRGKTSSESIIKPAYKGDGLLMLEPIYKHLILLDVSDWDGNIVLDDGLFLASETKLKHKIISRNNVSSAIPGGEGLFNLCLSGQGWLCIESRCPKEELIDIYLNNDVLKIDGNMVVAWSSSLEFTVERSDKSFIGYAALGEGLVNVYRGTGRVLMCPV